MEGSRTSTNYYRAKVMISSTGLGVAADAETIMLNVKTLVAPAGTDATDGTVTITSVDEDATVGVTVSASWPEFATVIAIPPTSPAKTLPVHVALDESVEVVHETESRAKSPVADAAFMKRGSLRLRVVVTDRAL